MLNTLDSSTNKNSLSKSQRELQLQIYEALQLQDQESVSLLKSKWVHRFGLNTLEDDQEIESLFLGEELRKEEEEKLELKPRSKEEFSQGINQQDLFEKNQDFKEYLEQDEAIDIEDRMEQKVLEDEFDIEQDEAIDIEDRMEQKVLEDELNPEQYNSDLNSQTSYKEEESQSKFHNKIDEIYNSTEQIIKDSSLKESYNSRNESNVKIENKEKKDVNAKEEKIIEVSPPPPPSINNLRRWLN